MYKTEENLQSAFARESQANQRYLFYAAKAEQDGYRQIARLFRAAADAETVHARNHFAAMDGVGSTQNNLLAATMGEHREFTQIYPLFIAEAESEDNKRAQLSFGYANEVEQIHYRLFEKALKALEARQPLEDEIYFVCQACGDTVAGAAPEKCPICNSPQSRFKRVE